MAVQDGRPVSVGTGPEALSQGVDGIAGILAFQPVGHFTEKAAGDAPVPPKDIPAFRRVFPEVEQ